MTSLAAHEVQAPMDAVGQINIRAPGRPEHHRIARRRAGEGVRSGIFPIVCLGLDDDSADTVDEQGHSYQPARDFGGVSPEVDGLQFCSAWCTCCTQSEPSPTAAATR